ncbi:MAG: BatD family protein [Aquimonas sp.]|nr:BatD family protein [Aquimonas sp.]
MNSSRFPPSRVVALLVLLLGLVSPALANEPPVRAFLDRDSIRLGETVTLNIESSQIGGAEPDLGPLASSFRVLGSSSSTQVSIVNGQRRSQTLWGVLLEPLEEGVIGIPPLEVHGGRTEPLRLTVLPPERPAPGVGDDVLLEVEISTDQPYVQRQVVYTLRLLYAVALLEGQLDEPQVPGAELRRLGGDATYTRDAGGRRYNVIERRYALLPQASGTLEIPGPRFRGRALTGRSGSRMLDPGSTVSAAAEARILEVRPRPAAGGEPWLPALELDYRLQTGAEAEIRVGEPITLNLRLSARGLAAEQLPELRLAPVPGAELYPDQEASATREGPRGLEGERSRGFALVPTRAGVLELPEQVLEWWDTAADAPRQARIPARRFQVLAAPGAVDADVPAAARPLSAIGSAGAAPAIGVGVNPLWRAASLLQAAILMLCLWLLWRHGALGLPLIAWLRRSAGDEAAMPPQAGPPLAQALRSGTPSEMAEALRALARGRGLAASLDALAAALIEPDQAAAVRRLQQHLYAEGSAAGLPELRRALQHAFRRPPRFGGATASSAEPGSDGLPPLYPPR